MSHIRTASGRHIYYDESETGAPVLLIPGHGGYRRGCLIWLAEALAPRFRVVVKDKRDAGESEPETAYYGLADMAGDVAALLDALGLVPRDDHTSANHLSCEIIRLLRRQFAAALDRCLARLLEGERALAHLIPPVRPSHQRRPWVGGQPLG